MVKELRNKRKDLIIKLRSVAKRAEERDLTPEEQAEVDGLKDQVNKLDARIAALEAGEVGEDDGGGEGEANSERSAGRRGVPIQARDLPDTDGRHPYSLMKVIRHMGGLGRLDGLEREMHQELEKRGDQTTKGVLVPWGLSTHRRAPAGAERRELTTATGTGSIANILGTDLIDLLRNKMVTRQAGAQVLSGMTGGTFSLPKQTAAGQTYWVAEGVAPTQANQTVGQVTFTPKTLGAFTDLSRKFMLQTSLDAEAFVKNDLAAIMAIEMDRAAINGSGSGAEPLGILGMSGVGLVALGTNGAAPTFGNLVDMETQVAVANADVESLGYITSVKARGTLKQTLKAANTAGKMLWEDDELNSYPALASNQVPANLTKGTGTNLSAAIFGNWASLVHGMWGAMDVIEDPYTKSSSGGLRIVFLQDMDIQARIAASFSRVVDMIAP